MTQERKGRYETANSYSYGDLKEHASELRKNMTPAEWLLWDKLNAGQLGLHFRRQHIIGNYIVDFVCLKLHLVIEVDGDYHGDLAQIDADAYRDWYLQQRGFKVLRFINRQVEANVDDVVTQIIKSLQ